MSRNDMLISSIAVVVIILTFGWCIKILLKAPIVGQIDLGTKAIQSGIPAEEKALINQQGSN